ncbi:hypothetical protein EV122DRAFT_203448 [Schizophyllum commune]
MHEAFEGRQSCSLKLYDDPGPAHISHISCLPSELLNIVFDHYRGDRYLDSAPTDPLWTLLHVCQRWRDVAQEHSSLWCRINTLLPTTMTERTGIFDESSSVSRTCTVLERYLANSHTLPLDIRALWVFREACWRPVLELVWRHHARWRDVNIRGDNIQQLADVIRTSLSPGQSQVVMPLLRCLRKPEAHDGTLVVDLSCLIPLLHTPGLSCLELPALVAYTPPHGLPWAQITRYRGAAYSLGERQFILSYMPNLEVCDALEGTNKPSRGSAFPVWRFHRLRALGLEKGAEWLQNIEAPLLEVLRAPVPDHRPILNFLERTNCATLTTLSTVYGAREMGDGQLHQIILSCPALHTLVLSGLGDSPPDLFSLLADTPADTLPQLAVLRIDPWHYFTGDVLETFLQRVMRLVQRLLAREARRLRSVEFYVRLGSLLHSQLLRVSREVLGEESSVLTVYASDYFRLFYEDFQELIVCFSVLWSDAHC